MDDKSLMDPVLSQLGAHLKHIMDALSVVTVVGTLTMWLPPIAALLSIIWTALRLVEMWTGKTVAQLRGK